MAIRSRRCRCRLGLWCCGIGGRDVLELWTVLEENKEHQRRDGTDVGSEEVGQGCSDQCGGRRWVKRASQCPPGVTVLGEADSVIDNFRLFHTPGPFFHWPLKLRSVPTVAKGEPDLATESGTAVSLTG